MLHCLSLVAWDTGDGNAGCNPEHSAAAVVRVKRMGNSSGWVTTGTLKLPPQGWCWLGGYSTGHTAITTH